MEHETPHEYAQRRANETRKAYLVTNLGHALWAHPDNRQLAELELGGIARIYRPQRREER